MVCARSAADATAATTRRDEKIRRSGDVTGTAQTIHRSLRGRRVRPKCTLRRSLQSVYIRAQASTRASNSRYDMCLITGDSPVTYVGDRGFGSRGVVLATGAAKGGRDVAQRRIEIDDLRFIGLTMLMWLAAASLAFAQEPATRAEADRQRREEKNRNAQPYKPGGFERAMHFVEEKAIFILGREGFYPEARIAHDGKRVRVRRRLSRSRPVQQQGHAGSVGRDEHAPVLGHRGAPDVSEAGEQAPAGRDVGRAPRLPAGGFLRHRPRLGSRRPDQLRHPIGPLRRARRRAPAADRAGGRRPRVSEPETRPGKGQPRAFHRAACSIRPPRRASASRSTTCARWPSGG